MCILLIIFLFPVKRYPNHNPLKEEQAQCPLSASSAESILSEQQTKGFMKEFTLVENLKNVTSVASALAKQAI